MKIKDLKKYLSLYDTETYLFKVVGPAVKKRGYLAFADFYKICMWKSARPKRRYVRNRNVVEKMTKKAFAEKDEVEKMKILCELDGVGIPTASALLTIPFPGKYAIIDIRCLETLKKILNFNISTRISYDNWLRYLEIMRKLAKENKVTPREMDKAFFAMHREMLENKSYKNLYNKN